MDDDTTSVSAALFGLGGFEILAAADAGGELELLVQTTADLVGCPMCGAVARAKDRRRSWVRDLPIGGRPVVICWVKRGLVLPAAAVRAAHLDRAARRDRTAREPDRAGPGMGVRAGRRR
jgi:hypothetical protein